MFTIPDGYDVVGGWVTYDAGYNKADEAKSDNGPTEAPAIDWVNKDLYIRNNASGNGSRSLS